MSSSRVPQSCSGGQQPNRNKPIGVCCESRVWTMTTCVSLYLPATSSARIGSNLMVILSTAVDQLSTATLGYTKVNTSLLSYDLRGTSCSLLVACCSLLVVLLQAPRRGGLAKKHAACRTVGYLIFLILRLFFPTHGEQARNLQNYYEL